MAFVCFRIPVYRDLIDNRLGSVASNLGVIRNHYLCGIRYDKRSYGRSIGNTVIVLAAFERIRDAHPLGIGYDPD